MDRKTLEYMEERAKKARVIVSRIDELELCIEHVQKAEKVRFMGFEYNIQVEVKGRNFLEELIAAYIGEAEEEITLLETELAEL